MFRRPLVPVLLALAASATAADFRPVAARLIAEQRRAALTKDKGYEERTFAPEFVTIGLQGHRFPRSQVIAERKQLLPLLDLRTADYQIQKIAAYRNGMILTVRQRTAGTVRDPRNRQPHPIATDALIDEAWIVRGGVWKIHLLRVLRYALTIDGKRQK